MGLEKAIKYKKEHRKPYYRSGAFDKSCRAGGDCPWCRQNRLKWRYKLKDEDRYEYYKERIS